MGLVPGHLFQAARQPAQSNTPAGLEWTDDDADTCKALFLDEETKELMWKISSDASMFPASMVNAPDRDDFVQEKSFLAMIRFHLLGS